MLMVSASQTVNGLPARSESTSDATKYPKPWSCDRGPRAAPCTPEILATAPRRARSVTTSSLAAFRNPYGLIGFGGSSSVAPAWVPSNTQSVEISTTCASPAASTTLRVAPT